MADTPDIAAVGALIGDRARAQMLLALMGGQALTATELATGADITKATASSHLRKLTGARLLRVASQGRHRYFRLADSGVADLLERLIGVAEGRVAARTFGPRDPLMRKARVCYDHIAGELGVLAHDSLVKRHLLRVTEDGPELNEAGAEFFTAVGVDVDALRAKRRPLCRACLDWSERRNHLGGAVGAALLLLTPASAFEAVAPVLIGAASLLLIAQPKIKGMTARPGGEHSWPLRGALAAVAVYVGYFGAAAGILLLAVLTAMLDQPLARVNAVKNVLNGFANAVAAVAFALFGPVRWAAVAPLAAGFLAGGWIGPALVRRIPAQALRIVIGVGGVVLAVRLGLTAYR